MFLVLAGRYQSLTLPLAVVLIVPMCLLGGDHGRSASRTGQQHPDADWVGRARRSGLQERHSDRRIRKQAEDQLGLDRFAAAAHAAHLRLRLILMTSFAFILGVVPLVVASGAGSEPRQALGTAVFAGMIGVTLFGLLFTPAFYVVCRRLALRREQPIPPPSISDEASATA